MRPTRSFKRTVWVENDRGANIGIEFFLFVDSNDWTLFNLLASEFFQQRVRVHRGEKPLLPYGERAQKILDLHRANVRRVRSRGRWFN